MFSVRPLARSWLSPLLAVLVMGVSASPVASSCNNCSAVRWCGWSWAGWKCCSDWATYGSGGFATTEEQANLFAWYGFVHDCPGTGASGDKPESGLAPTGGGTLDPLLNCGGFGSSGNAGVVAQLPHCGSLDLGWTPLTATVSGADSAFVYVGASGVSNGPNFGYLRYSDSGAGQFKLDADFSAGGSSSLHVDCYLAGNLVASGFPQPNGRLGDVQTGGAWPRGAGTICSVTGLGRAVGIGLVWASPVGFHIQGSAGLVSCDSVAVVPAGLSSGLSNLTSVTLRFKNMNPLSLSSLDYATAAIAPLPAMSWPSIPVLGLLLFFVGAGRLVRTRAEGHA